MRPTAKATPLHNKRQHATNRNGTVGVPLEASLLLLSRDDAVALHMIELLLALIDIGLTKQGSRRMIDGISPLKQMLFPLSSVARR